MARDSSHWPHEVLLEPLPLIHGRETSCSKPNNVVQAGKISYAVLNLKSELGESVEISSAAVICTQEMKMRSLKILVRVSKKTTLHFKILALLFNLICLLEMILIVGGYVKIEKVKNT